MIKSSLIYRPFKKIVLLCLLIAYTINCLGFSSRLIIDSVVVKQNSDTLFIGSKYDDAHFENTLTYSPSRFDYLIAQRQDSLLADIGILATSKSYTNTLSGYIMEVDAPFNPGCLCLDEPLLVTAKLSQPPTASDINIFTYPDNKFYYHKSGHPQIKSTTPYDVFDALKEPLPLLPSLARDRILNTMTTGLPYSLFLNTGPKVGDADFVKLAASFGQSAYNMVRMLLVIAGQEVYVQLLETGGGALSMAFGGLRKVGIPIPDPTPHANNVKFFDDIINGFKNKTYAPLGYSIPIGFSTKAGATHTDLVTESAPYTRPVFKRPKTITPKITSSGPVYIRPASFVKNALYVKRGEEVTFNANTRSDEDPNDGVIHYLWVGFPSVTALGLGQALSSNSKMKQITPFTVKMNKPFLYAGVYALMAYRGPMPPIGCTRVSEWTDIKIGCTRASDREGLIRIKGDYDFPKIAPIGGKGERERDYTPVVYEGDNITLVSGGVGSPQPCKYTYEWYGPARDGSALNVLIGACTKITTVDVLDEKGKPTGFTGTVHGPEEDKEKLVLKNMTPEMSGVYTRIATRVPSKSLIDRLVCLPCSQKAELTIAVLSSKPKLAVNSPLCEGEDLVIAITPTTSTLATAFQWAYKENITDPDPDKWSAWITEPIIRLPKAKTTMSGIYLVRERIELIYNGKGGKIIGKDKKRKMRDGQPSYHVTANPATIAIEVKPNIPINFSLLKDEVYANEQAILTASLGANTAPAEGLTIAITNAGGSALNGIHYESLPESIYIPPYQSSISTPITTKWQNPTKIDLAKTITITGKVTKNTSPSKSCYVNPASIALTIKAPLSPQRILTTKQTTIDAASFDWKPEDNPQENTTYRWYKNADKSGGAIKQGRGADGVYTILTPTPGTYSYYISSQEDGYSENEPTKIELIAQHVIYASFDKSSILQGKQAILTLSLSESLTAPPGGLDLKIDQTGSSAKGLIHHEAFASTIQIPEGNRSTSMIVSTKGNVFFENDVALLVRGESEGYLTSTQARLTIIKNPANSVITLKFTNPTVKGGAPAFLTASLAPGIIAGSTVKVTLQADPKSSAVLNQNYANLKTVIIIPTGSNSAQIEAFEAINNNVIDGASELIIQGTTTLGYATQAPNPTILILDQTGEDQENAVITLAFEQKLVRGGTDSKLTIGLPPGITSAKPLLITLNKRTALFPDQQAKKDIDYKMFSFTVLLEANTNATSIPIRTLSNYKGEVKTLWMTGKSDNSKFRVNSDKVNIITPEILIPNVFSPDEAIHNTWEIPNLNLYEHCTVKVYNRWGRVVFKSRGYPEEWDGTFKNQPLPQGVYYYKINLKDGSPPILGSVSIFR